MKTAPAGALFGTNFNYSIIVSNGGPSTATSLIVTDSLPNGLAFVSSVPNTTTNASNQVIWNISSLAANTASNFTLTVISTQRGSATNVASVGGPTLDPIPTNNLTPPVVTIVTNFPPLANPDSASMTENTTNTISPLINDVVRTPGGMLTIIFVSPTNGTASISGTNVIFTPTPNFIGVATIGYTITDNVGGTNTSLITVTVTNIPPLANPDTYSVGENSGTNVFSPLTNDVVQTPGGTLALVSVTTTNGSVGISGTNVLFAPSTNFLGITTLIYVITDGIGGTNTGVITVNVTNRLPVAVNDFASTPKNVAVTVPVLANDFDPDFNPLTIVSVAATNGFASISGTNVIFTPTNNFLGLAFIGYTITDGNGGTNSALITVTVTNRLPVAVNDSTNTAENVAVTIPVLVNDTDPDGDALFIIVVTPTNGVALISGQNIIFTPATNFIGTATIGYLNSDGYGGSSYAVVTIGVTNRPPVANPDGYFITENTTNTFSVLTNDLVLTPGGTLTIIAATTTNGTVLISGTNLVFTPGTNFLGTNIINYTIIDNVGGTNSTFVTVVVTNIPPIANPDGYTVFQNSTNTFSPLTNDVVRTPGGTLSIVSITPTNGTANISGTNIIFTPTPGFTGTATIGYTITDGIGGTNSTVITINVLALTDISVSKTGAANVYAGTNFNYTITVTNFGPGTAASLSVTDNLPALATFVSSTTGATLTGNQLVWTNLGSLAANAGTNLTITVTAPLTSTTLTNLASGGSPTSDPTPTNNFSPPVFTTVTPVADVSLVKTAPASVLPGTNFNYTITVSNAGPSSAASLSVTDNLPANITFVSATAGYVTNGSQLVWTNLGTLLANSATNLSITVTAPVRGGKPRTPSPLAHPKG